MESNIRANSDIEHMPYYWKSKQSKYDTRTDASPATTLNTKKITSNLTKSLLFQTMITNCKNKLFN